MADSTFIHPAEWSDVKQHADNPDGLSPADLYAKMVGDTPPLPNDTPRRLTDEQMRAAELGHDLGFMAVGWLGMSMLFLPLAALDGSIWAILFVGMFIAVGCALLRLAHKVGLRRAQLARDGMVVWGVIAGRWTTTERRKSDTGSGYTTYTAQHALLLYPDGRGGIAVARLSASSEDADAGSKIMLLYPPDKPEEARRATQLSGGMAFTPAGELTVSEPKVRLVALLRKAMWGSVGLMSLLAVLIMALRALS